MSAENTMNMEERLLKVILRAYDMKALKVQEWPYVAMDACGSWYAYKERPTLGVQKVWDGRFAVQLGVNGGIADPEESLFCWTVKVVPRADSVLNADVLAGRRDASATVRRVWIDQGNGEAIEADVSVVCEPLPAPQEVRQYRRATDQELDVLFLGSEWSDVCPIEG